MTLPNDTIEKALRMLGYSKPRKPPDVLGKPVWTNIDHDLIPLDLASLLKRCREQGFIYNFDADHLGFVRVRLVHNKSKVRVFQSDGYPNELAALFLALAAAWDAKEKGGAT